ncbi:MAG TPA: hypothetical protein VJ110_01615 [Candidatus Nanoarchaeia archaeon]|nr:hypothetical protein [Candidatus Nanoarchaeia archaeon]
MIEINWTALFTLVNSGILTGIFYKLGKVEAKLTNHGKRLNSHDALHPRR